MSFALCWARGDGTSINVTLICVTCVLSKDVTLLQIRLATAQNNVLSHTGLRDISICQSGIFLTFCILRTYMDIISMCCPYWSDGYIWVCVCASASVCLLSQGTIQSSLPIHSTPCDHHREKPRWENPAINPHFYTAFSWHPTEASLFNSISEHIQHKV